MKYLLIILFIATISNINSAYSQSVQSYSCSAWEYDENNPIEVKTFDAKNFFNEHLFFRAEQQTDYFMKVTSWMNILESNHPKVFEEISNKYKTRSSSQSPVYIHLFDHPGVKFAGQSDADKKNKQYFFSVSDAEKFPDCHKDVDNQPEWRTTKCMFLAHELVEALRGFEHNDGIEVENKIRKSLGIVLRNQNARILHVDHCDALIPMGDFIERFHFKYKSNRLNFITLSK